MRLSIFCSIYASDCICDLFSSLSDGCPQKLKTQNKAAPLTGELAETPRTGAEGFHSLSDSSYLLPEFLFECRLSLDLNIKHLPN